MRTETLEVNWNSPSPRPVDRRVIKEDIEEPSFLGLLLGRWLMVGDNYELRCYDLDCEQEWATPVTKTFLKVKCMEARSVTREDRSHSSFVVTHDAMNTM